MAMVEGQKMSLKKIILWNGVIFFCFTLLLLGAAELGFRVFLSYRSLSRTDVHRKINLCIPDDRLGWLPSDKWFLQQYNEKTKNGFRVYGDVNTAKKKILIVGDSYTHAVDVPVCETYYSRVMQKLPVEVFACGVAGYGSFQEYLLVDEYIDTIKPDIIIVQFAFNDFFNNYFELEQRSNYFNNYTLRPYLTIQSEIVYRNPDGSGGALSVAKIPYMKRSQLLVFVESRLRRLKAQAAKKNNKSIENKIIENSTEEPLFAASVEITDKIFAMFRKRVPQDIGLYVFADRDIQPFYNELIGILNRNNIGFIEGVPQAVENAPVKGGAQYTPDGFHWSALGHEVVAEQLGAFLEDKMINN